ncbi:hypothetical protein GAYE_SCF78G7067 [Galdieria yellowstonensis]|uniref:Uncharacterized protein n=1 Tax=Galdieria yellowstonensis TaxID=3028027 RepID=A0AAV9INW8_9RHOD|nr:hypothetical protein GAYE_SCF78G7067 [Galdieria yellowstonensis]
MRTKLDTKLLSYTSSSIVLCLKNALHRSTQYSRTNVPVQRKHLGKSSGPFTCLQVFFACRDWKFSVVEKLNRSLHAQDKVSRRQWQLQGKDIPVVEKYQSLVVEDIG